MKSLEKLTNVEKARLLHQLFPQEIPALIDYAEDLCLTIREDESTNKATWNNGIITIEYWLHLVTSIEDKIKQYHPALSKRPKLFADQLFDGHLAMVMLHVLHLYTTTRQHPDPKFSMAINLLFN